MLKAYLQCILTVYTVHLLSGNSDFEYWRADEPRSREWNVLHVRHAIVVTTSMLQIVLRTRRCGNLSNQRALSICIFLQALFSSAMTIDTPSPNCVRASLESFGSDQDKNSSDETFGSPTTSRRLENAMVDEPRDELATKILPLGLIRSQFLRTSAAIGLLCQEVLHTAPINSNNSSMENMDTFPNELSKTLRDVLDLFIETASLLEINLEAAIYKKMKLNERKYPASLCKGKAGKYTEYSKTTGITKDQGQSTIHIEMHHDPAPNQWFLRDRIEPITDLIRSFALERNWTRFHHPRNLALALLGEFGELCELLQFEQDIPAPLTITQHDKLGQELADVTIYLLRLADVCNIKWSNDD